MMEKNYGSTTISELENATFFDYNDLKSRRVQETVISEETRHIGPSKAQSRYGKNILLGSK